MRLIVTLFLMNIVLVGNVLDDFSIYKANKALKNNDYNSSYNHLIHISNKTDNINYDIANSLYRQKKYKKAIKFYKKINDKKLRFKALHNLGNSYAKLMQYQKAINSYEEALKIKNDKDTKFNLDLLKKRQKNKNKNKKNNNNKNKKSNNNKNKKSNNNKDKKDDKNSKKKKQNSGEKKKDIKERKDNTSNNNNKKDKKKDEQKNDKQKRDNIKEQKLKQNDLSHLQEKRYQKMLNNRKLNTLMIPLKNKGDKNENNINPW